MTESSANKILMLNDNTPSGSSDVPSATPQRLVGNFQGMTRVRGALIILWCAVWMSSICTVLLLSSF